MRSRSQTVRKRRTVQVGQSLAQVWVDGGKLDFPLLQRGMLLLLFLLQQLLLLVLLLFLFLLLLFLLLLSLLLLLLLLLSLL
jgi:hypothetical protein